MDMPFRPSNVIEIDDDSDDSQIPQLEDFMTAEELLNLRGTMDATPAFYPHSYNFDGPASPIGHVAKPSPTKFGTCLEQVLEVFPDVSHDHVQTLYDELFAGETQVAVGAPIPELLIAQILDGGKYPKERDRQRELKRKRSTTKQDSDDERKAKWQTPEHVTKGQIYSEQARHLIQVDFPDVPRRFIDAKYKELGHLYPTYLALDIAEENYDISAPRPYERLKHSRKPKFNGQLVDNSMYPTGYGYPELRAELAAARAQRAKLQTKRKVQKDAVAADAAAEKALRDSNQVMECKCCFDDVTINKITFCSGDDPHPFCFDCATQNADTQIGLSRYTLSCMDGSGCQATFSRGERARFLDAKKIDKLERLQQQTELRQADLANLETCPWCDFAAICPPIEVDREFRCGNEECEKISCRKCRLVTHVPLTCEEFKKDNGLSERHVIEEARTQALIRTCIKCKQSVIKMSGCNMMHCSCGATLCDVCGKDISKDNYLHFSDSTTVASFIPGKKRCPKFDREGDRMQKSIEKAGEDAMKKIREQNPDLTEEELKIKFDARVSSPPRGEMGFGYPAYHMAGLPMRGPALPGLERAVDEEIARQMRLIGGRPPMEPQPYYPGMNALAPPRMHPDVMQRANIQPHRRRDAIAYPNPHQPQAQAGPGAEARGWAVPAAALFAGREQIGEQLAAQTKLLEEQNRRGNDLLEQHRRRHNEELMRHREQRRQQAREMHPREGVLPGERAARPGRRRGNVHGEDLAREADDGLW
ncbi:MAG: hypothetical protein Q9183_002567 [Haloplaca sp. 2 TL-2023]